MKNILKSIICLSIFTSFVSCNDFLTIIPEDKQVLETYYTSEDAVNNNTASLYTGNTWQDFDVSFMWLAGDLMSGDIYYNYDQEGQFYYLSFNAGNKYLNQGWNGLYRVVSYCNNIINGMPTAARNNGVSETVINRALGEARCIRAITYYMLTEYWDDVPIVTDNNMSSKDVVRHTQKSVYKFIQKDLEFAKDNLPTTQFETGRCTKWTAEGMLAKLHLTMASHLSDAESAENFTLAKNYAEDVIKNSGLSLVDINGLKTMFYPQGENNSESLFAIQCISYNYGYGNTRNAHHARNSIVNGSSNAWGAGKGPTLSLQNCFESGDLRRPLTYMRNGDSYTNLGGGGYTYLNASGPLDASPAESPDFVLAHIRKYVIGTNADCNGEAGSNQDAGNNLYLLRLSDVYLCYVEACIGSGSSTSDALALNVFNQIRSRAGVSSKSVITYDELIKERRTEFAFESINFFDIKRMSYRDENKAITYMNNMKREAVYVANAGNFTWTEMNAANVYHGGFTPVAPADDPSGKGTIFYIDSTVPEIKFAKSNLVLPIPSETVTKTPNIGNDPIDYQF